jgi:membrane protease YdiL (CAAX protease family)
MVTQIFPAILGGILLAFSAPRDVLRDSKALLKSEYFAQAMLWAMLVAQVVSACLALLVVRLFVGKEWPRIIALRRPNWFHIVLALIGWPALACIVSGIDDLASRVLPRIGDLEEMIALFGKWPLPLGILVIGLGPGIGEELWCRGFLGRGLVGRYGVIVGVLLTSLCFGLIHLEPRQVVYASFMGYLLHLAYLASRSLLIPVLIHVVNNSIAILASHISALQALDPQTARLPWYVYGSAILLLLAVGWAFWKTRTIFVDQPMSGGETWRPAFAGVAHPPSDTATRVLYPRPKLSSLLPVCAGLAAFIGAIVAAVRA